MRDNIVTAQFLYSDYTQTLPVWQYDYGLILQITGIDLPAAYEVHFAGTTGESITQIGTADGVSIPDQFLLTGQSIRAWIYLHTGEDDGETVKYITIPVTKRAKPSDLEPTPVQQDAITEAIAALNAGVDAVQDIADGIPQTVEDALTEAKESGEFDGPPGPKGDTGPRGETGSPGPAGADGFSPTASVSKSGSTATITITDKTGTTTAQISDGQTGPAGPAGPQGAKGDPGDDYVITDADYAAIAAVTAESLKTEPLYTAGNLIDIDHAAWSNQNLATQNDSQGRAPGTVFDSDNFRLTGPIAIDTAEPLLHLWRTAYESGSHYLRVGFYDANDDPLNGFQAWGNTASGGERVLVIPAGTVAIRVAMSKDDIANPLTIAYRTLTGHMPYGPAGKNPAVQDSLAEVVTSRTAAKDYSVGDLIMIGGQLWRVSAAIAEGAALVAGTNIDLTTIAAELKPEVINVTGSAVTLTARAGVRYLCGTLSSLTLTPPASGLCEVVFTSGTTPTILTLPSGVAMPDWWTDTEANRTYDLMIADGARGAVMSWTA